jgi:uncharacterized protein YbjT (DUF2867 family)
VRIVVLGATGAVGSHVVRHATQRGHAVVAASRHGEAPTPATGRVVDLRTGEGLRRALQRDDVVIDVSNVHATRAKPAIEAFTAMANQVTLAADAAGVARIVVLSIVGIDDVPLGYYRGKRAQEATYRLAKTSVTVLRSTQFHEFIGQVLPSMTKAGIAFVPRSMIQPVAAADVATALLDAAEAPYVERAEDIGGPEIHPLPDLAQRWVDAHGGAPRVMATWLPGRAASRMANGGLLLTSGRTTTLTFDEWLRNPRST